MVSTIILNYECLILNELQEKYQCVGRTLLAYEKNLICMC